ncbi:MAG: hypothetical protein GY913_12685 [Proteobacteria bacterium]|nr:hypothetical protein [Pseudomonadota bacterium]MCP4917762.1 hypothetical protein [Pseudomonadota bacterium]
MLHMLMSLAFAGRTVDVEVQLPEVATAGNVYTSSTEIWRLRNGRALGSFQSTSEDLNCRVEGRWLVTEIKMEGSEFPTQFPHAMRCWNNDMTVQVDLVQATSWAGRTQYANGVVVMPRTRGTIQRASVTVPYDHLDSGRVVADVRGVWCEVEDSTVNVRVAPTVVKPEATCELPTDDGGTMPLKIELPRDL